MCMIKIYYKNIKLNNFQNKKKYFNILISEFKKKSIKYFGQLIKINLKVHN